MRDRQTTDHPDSHVHNHKFLHVQILRLVCEIGLFEILLVRSLQKPTIYVRIPNTSLKTKSLGLTNTTI